MRATTTILHPTDFSEHSREALDLAASLARDRNARLILLHAVPTAAPATDGGGAAARQRAEHCSGDLRSYQAEMAEKLRRLDVPAVPQKVERLVEEGDPAAVILRKADASTCDLIVMGTHGRTGELRRLMGSVAEEVSRKASCRVLTVKSPAREPRAVETSPAERVSAAL